MKKFLYLVYGIEFKDMQTIDSAELFGDAHLSHNACKAAAHANIDNAYNRYFMV